MMKSIEWSPASGEDAGKKFVITRMSAFTADRWARHAVKALIRAGAKIPERAADEGILSMGGMAMQLFGEMDDDACDAAFTALEDCVKISRGGLSPAPLLEADINDPMTLTDLRAEAFRLHVGFFKAAAVQISPLAAALMPAESSGQPPAA